MSTFQVRSEIFPDKVQFSPNSTLLAVLGTPDTVATGSSALLFYDVAATRSMAGFRVGCASVTGIPFSPDGKSIALPTAGDDITVWSTSDGQKQYKLDSSPLTPPPNGKAWITFGERLELLFSPDGQTIAAGGTNYVANLWDASTGKHRTTLVGHTDYYVQWLAFSPDSKLLASIAHDRRISVRNNKITFSDADDVIRIWDVPTGRQLYALPFERMAVTRPIFSPDSKLLAARSSWKSATIWDMTTGQVVHTLREDREMVDPFAFSPDGKLLIAVSGHAIRLYDVATGVVHRELRGHTDTITSVVISKDGQLIASGGRDRTVRLWHMATGEMCAKFDGHGQQVRDLAFSPDGKLLVSLDNYRQIRIWGEDTQVEEDEITMGLAK